MASLLVNILDRTPLASSFGDIALPLSAENALTKKPLNPDPQTCELRIEGMTCGSCVESIEGMLRTKHGIYSITVALLAERGVIEYDPIVWTTDKLINEISDIGFDATLIPPTCSDIVTLRIYGMTCSSCTSTVENTLKGVPGINDVSVSLATETCRVQFNHNVVGPREMVERIEEMGFDAILSDQEDATQIRSLSRTKEIQEWRSRLLWSVTFALPVFFINMIAPHIPFLLPVLNFRLMRGIYLQNILVFLLTTPAQFWIGAKFYRNAYKSLRHGSATMDVLVMLGTSAAYFYSLIVMIFATTNPSPDYKPYTFFDTSTMLIMFVSLGRYLENKAKGRTSAALTDLMALTPSMATIYTNPACTTEKRIPTELVQVGDTVKLIPGDKVPADGTVVRGSSSIDESAVTGEPVPVTKQAGDSVIGGTINGLGTLDMLVLRAGKDTALAQIVKLVEDAQTSKAPIQAYADRVAGLFVPTVISLATVTFLIWMIVSNIIVDDSLPDMFHRHGVTKFAVCLQICISVIVVACPCALGLSTPTAIMVGTGMGAKNGILIKSGEALEASCSVKKIVMDKTGTLTRGKLTVACMCWLPSDDRAELYSDAAASLSTLCADGRTSRAELIAMLSAAEARSEHPLAKAVAVYGKDLLARSGMDAPDPSIEAFESFTGQGVKASISLSGSKYTLLVGNARFATQSDDGHLPPSLSSFESQEVVLGRTVIYVSLCTPSSSRSFPVLAVSLSDAPRPTSEHAIKAMHSMGLEVYMMTGDGKTTALAVAKQVGIKPENVMANLSPKGKASLVTELTGKDGKGVAMVGDGINDSPALVAATVGIALSSGTNVAIEAADIVIMRSDLLDVVAALHLSRSIFAVIKRNLIWACVYNVIGIPLAMGIFLPFGLYMHPMMAGAAMAFSSVSVVTSSLMLKWWKRPAVSVMPGESIPGETLLESVRNTLEGVLDSMVGLIRRRRNREYSQLPVELSDAI